jgi:hypothetical protein
MPFKRDPKEDVVKAGALRLTWISGTIGALGVVVTAFNEHIVKIFGDEVDDGIKASVLIAIIAAWALIAVADLIARAITTSARLRVPSPGIAVPNGMRVTLTDGVDSDGWLVAAARPAVDGTGDGLQFLVVKSGEGPKWVDQAGVALEGSKAPG